MATLLRVQLHPVEQNAAPATVAVTGASGYMAGAIVKRLLAIGHTVHATVRNPDKEESVQHLKALPGASDRLKLYAADLLQDASFDTAIAGVDYVVHSASPFINSVKKGEERKRLIEPAVNGTVNVLGSVNRAGSVKRVALTSSVVAVYHNAWDRGQGHHFTEADWNETSSETNQPYYASKTLAEKKAWEIVKQQNRWDLVTILPGFIVGPPLSSRADGESVGLMKEMLQGKFWPFAPPFGFGCVDVDDVAAAHSLALHTPSASGRYLCGGRSAYFKQWGDILKQEYPKRKLPVFEGPPKLVLLMLAPLLGLRQDFIKTSYGRLPQFDSSKAERELGLRFLPLERSLKDMAAAELQLGIAK